ncbi:MAG TPA: hypothetical protein VLH86_02090 [Patescibacteria group bacterium]|nr:hypothetical protein [Patescibacteria group bacterium]
MSNSHELTSAAGFQPGATIGAVGSEVLAAVGNLSSEPLQVADDGLRDAAATVAAVTEASAHAADLGAPLDRARDHLHEASGQLARGRDNLLGYLGVIGAPAFDNLPEWSLLSGADVMATPDQATADVTAEMRRTRCSTDCLQYIYEGGDANYEALTAVQDPAVRLSREDFDDLHSWLRELIGDEDTYRATQYIMLIHDIGKSGRVYDAMGLSQHDVDHDEALTLLINDPRYADVRRRLLPMFDTMTENQQQLIRDVFGVRFNYPQFLQGEAPATTLEDLPETLSPQARGIFIAHAILDIAGAAGHRQPNGSVTLTGPTVRKMKSLNAALTDPNLTTPEERNNAFLDAEIAFFAPDIPITTAQERAAMRAQIRLAGSLRLSTPEQFAELHDVFIHRPMPIQHILTAELNRTGLRRATLPYYGPVLLRTLAEKTDTGYALTYLAHILQEAHIADQKAREAGETGIIVASFGDLTKAILNGDIDPRETPIRFVSEGTMLIPRPVKPTLHDLAGVPDFAGGEQLRGKRVVMAGLGGGSDVAQAKKLGELLEDKYGCTVTVVMSVRNEERRVVNGGERIGQATQEITPDTRADGDWRYLEDIPLEGARPMRSLLLNSSDPSVIQRDLQTVASATGADVIIGVDTGGDSLYRSEHAGFSAHLPTDITPDQDYQSLQGLVGAVREGVQVLTAIVAPGVDSPPYAREVLDEIGATQIPLDAADRASIEATYADWHMDGSGSEQGRYGKTPLAWLLALQGQTGLQYLNLPTANVVSDTNPWRAFTYITPAMSGVVLMDAERHLNAVRRQPQT